MPRYSGGFISKSGVTPNVAVASGMWSLSDMTAYVKAGTWPRKGSFAVGSGGTEATYVNGSFTYKEHRFTTSGTFTCTTGGSVDVLIVGAGGGGGMLGGGGGGGAVIVATGNITAGTYTVTVGNGGAGNVGWATSGSTAKKGGPSSVFGMTAYGGGGARGYSSSGQDSENQTVGNYGGLGYTMTSYSSVSASFGSMSLAAGFTGTIYSNNSGGLGSTLCCPCGGGGGGGAGGAGTSNSSVNASSNRPDGGIGVIGTIGGVPFYNSNYYWGGGGGADAYCATSAGIPGKGGGGGGGDESGGLQSNGDTFGINPGGNGLTNGGNGGTNTGGGAGAGCNGSGSTSVNGGTGGSGIVVIRYRTV